MKENKEELIEKFKIIENKLIEILKNNDIQFDENSTKKGVKTKITKYIKKVAEAKELFSEYESLAHKIETVSEKESDIANDVVELRQTDETSGYENQVVVNDGDVKVKAFKKKNSKGREF